jgi:magnesium-transporting ATPase (P-type)
MAFAYFLIEFVITLNITEKVPLFGKKLNEEMWLIKISVWIVLSILFVIFISNSFFEVVAEIAKYLASIFVFIMIVTLIDFLYKWSAHWVKIYDSGA